LPFTLLDFFFFDLAAASAAAAAAATKKIRLPTFFFQSMSHEYGLRKRKGPPGANDEDGKKQKPFRVSKNFVWCSFLTSFENICYVYYQEDETSSVGKHWICYLGLKQDYESSSVIFCRLTNCFF